MGASYFWRIRMNRMNFKALTFPAVIQTRWPVNWLWKRGDGFKRRRRLCTLAAFEFQGGIMLLLLILMTKYQFDMSWIRFWYTFLINKLFVQFLCSVFYHQIHLKSSYNFLDHRGMQKCLQKCLRKPKIILFWHGEDALQGWSSISPFFFF